MENSFRLMNKRNGMKPRKIKKSKMKLRGILKSWKTKSTAMQDLCNNNYFMIYNTVPK